MAKLNSEDRRLIVENLSRWLEHMVRNERNDVEVNLEAGMQRALGEDLETAVVRPDGSSTLTVRIRPASSAGTGGRRHWAR